MEKIQIVYYTGTGSTKIIAEEIYQQLTALNIESELHRLTVDSLPVISKNMNFDTKLILLYAVHAFNAPDLVYTLIKSLEEISNRSAMVISVSGGGAMISNTACREPVKRLLKKKGFNVVTEAMAVMPNNWISPVPEEIAKELVRIVPNKVSKWLKAFLHNKSVPYVKPIFIDYPITSLGRLEVIGAKFFGKRIKVNSKCNGCGHCVKNCPANNITFIVKDSGDKTLNFDSKCHFCLSCLYECPQHALSPGFLKFAVIPTGYPLKLYCQPTENPLSSDAILLALKGKAWEGVRRYLIED
ncbi:EFR1 family ferrodoxin [Fusibacter bizertensis]